MAKRLKPSIIFEDTHLVVIDKPAGLLSQGESTEDPNVVDWLRQYLGRNYVGLIHRLDRNVSGIMVVAKRTKAARRLTEALQAGTLKRTYIAALIGSFRGKHVWELWLVKDRQKNQVYVVNQKTKHAKKAVLAIKVLQPSKWYHHRLTLVEAELKTGRSHQIRVQASQMGTPLLGDPKYGLQKWKNIKPFGRPALHSLRVEFPHPMTGEVMHFVAPPPNDMKRLID